MATLILLAAMFVLLWVLLIRPQRQRQQKQQNLLASVAPGDEVLTVGGLYGIVQEIDDEDDLVVEVAEGIHVRIARRAIAAVVKPDDEDDEDDVDGAGETGVVDDETASDASNGEEPVNDREEIVSEGPAEDTPALDRR